MSLNAHLRDLADKIRGDAPRALETIDAMVERLDLDGVGASAPKAGERVPDVTLIAPDGSPTPLRQLFADRPLVLMFYRGRWCPFCDLTLRATEVIVPQLEEAGAMLIGVSPQTLDETSLTASERGLSYALFADPRNAAARAFGLEWRIREGAERAFHRDSGAHIDQANGDDEWRLPSPAVFIIDRDGMVRWAWTDSNWTRRAEPDDVLAAAKTVTGR